MPTLIDFYEVKRRTSGQFFSEGATRFFLSRYPQTAYSGPGGIYFVTSEKFDYNSPRLYTVRRLKDDGTVDTMGDFNKLTRARANTIARNLADLTAG